MLIKKPIHFLIICILILTGSQKSRLASSKSESEGKKVPIMEQIETDLSREKEQFIKFEGKERTLLEQLSSIEKSIAEKRTILKALGQRIKEAKRELEVPRANLIRMEDSLSLMETLLSKRLVAFYKYARRGYLNLIAATKDLDELNHRIKYFRIILAEDQKTMKHLADNKKFYKQEVASIEEKLSIISDLEKTEQQELSALNSDLGKKVILLSKIHKEKEFYGTAVRELQSAADNLKETLLDLGKTRDDKESFFSDFATQKGKLPKPINGKIIDNNNKQKGGQIFAARKGIYIEGSFGDEVKAVFPGIIDFSDQLKGYGEVIIINHGDRFYTIFAYLLQRFKSEGEVVEKGEVIGKIGEAGLVTGPALYFEIRERETSLDPMEWLKVN